MNKKYLIIYHKEDNDGVFSGALFYHYLITDLKIDKSDIDLFGADYNTLDNFIKTNDINDLYKKYKTIIMTDISFNNINYFKLLYKKFKSEFVWCDHHAPIIKNINKTYLNNIPGIRDISCSALLCTYRYLYDPFNVEQENIPNLFKVLSAWDSFTYKENNYSLDYVKNVNIGVNYKYQLNIKEIIAAIQNIMTSFLNKEIDDLLLKEFENYGKIINTYQDFINETIINTSADTTWKIYTGEKLIDNTPLYRNAVALFIQGPSNSLIFKSLNRLNNNYMNGIVFKRNSNSTWTISLYNIKENDNTFHCGEFLKKYYNGGGHSGAAGCTVSEDDFINMLKTKCLGIK
jgi:hypothetical protein